jgi:hypothetical protein
VKCHGDVSESTIIYSGLVVVSFSGFNPVRCEYDLGTCSTAFATIHMEDIISSNNTIIIVIVIVIETWDYPLRYPLRCAKSCFGACGQLKDVINSPVKT